MEGLEKTGQGGINVLILPPVLERNVSNLFINLEDSYNEKFSFFTVKPIPRKENFMVDYEELWAKCKTIIRQEDISIVYANKPMGSFLAALLSEEFPHIKGPSSESIFLCHHKYYTYKFVDSRSNNLPYEVLNLNGDLFDTAFELLPKCPLPGIVRPCLGSGSCIYCFHNRDQLIKVLTKSKEDIAHLLELQSWMLDLVVKEKYPLALEPVSLIHPYLERRLASEGQTWTNVCVEACVFEKEIIPWAISNVVTLPYGEKEITHGFSGFEMPTSLARNLQEITWEEFRKDIEKLVEFGFDNSFVHAEYFVFENGYVHLVSINGRVKANSTRTYLKALDNGNNLQASLDISQGIKPTPPSLNGNYVLTHSMIVAQTGKSDSIIDFIAVSEIEVSENPEVFLYYKSGQDVVIEPDKDYARLGTITVIAEDFKDAFKKIKILRSKVIKLHGVVPLYCFY